MTRQDLAYGFGWAVLAGVLLAVSDGGWKSLVAIVAALAVANVIGRAEGRAQERERQTTERNVSDLGDARRRHAR